MVLSNQISYIKLFKKAKIKYAHIIVALQVYSYCVYLLWEKFVYVHLHVYIMKELYKSGILI